MRRMRCVLRQLAAVRRHVDRLDDAEQRAQVAVDEAPRDVAHHAHEDQIVLAFDDAEEMQIDARVVHAAAAVKAAAAVDVLGREHRFDAGARGRRLREVAQPREIDAVGVLLQRQIRERARLQRAAENAAKFSRGTSWRITGPPTPRRCIA